MGLGFDPSGVPFEILHFVRDLKHSKCREVSLPCVKIIVAGWLYM